jgi:hypothetical protein
MSDEEFEEMTSEEIADALEASLEPAERAEFDRHCWAVAWERAVLDGDLEGANVAADLAGAGSP